ncbi:MAG: DUF2461 family protein [Bacteroidetes bacterium]|nr:DUF2461 family protein [Bacteroidota bacterium]
MSKINKSTFKFLSDLKKNNNREWFNDNKPIYEEARANFEEFIANLISNISKFDPPIAGLNPRKSIFRIYRDYDPLKFFGKIGFFIIKGSCEIRTLA